MPVASANGSNFADLDAYRAAKKAARTTADLSRGTTITAADVLSPSTPLLGGALEADRERAAMCREGLTRDDFGALAQQERERTRAERQKAQGYRSVPPEPPKAEAAEPVGLSRNKRAFIEQEAEARKAKPVSPPEMPVRATVAPPPEPPKPKREPVKVVPILPPTKPEAAPIPAIADTTPIMIPVKSCGGPVPAPVGPDPEVSAMGAMVTILGGLDSAAKCRVLYWAGCRFLPGEAKP